MLGSEILEVNVNNKRKTAAIDLRQDRSASKTAAARMEIQE